MATVRYYAACTYVRPSGSGMIVPRGMPYSLFHEQGYERAADRLAQEYPNYRLVTKDEAIDDDTGARLAFLDHEWTYRDAAAVPA